MAAGSDAAPDGRFGRRLLSAPPSPASSRERGVRSRIHGTIRTLFPNLCREPFPACARTLAAFDVCVCPSLPERNLIDLDCKDTRCEEISKKIVDFFRKNIARGGKNGRAAGVARRKGCCGGRGGKTRGQAAGVRCADCRVRRLCGVCGAKTTAPVSVVRYRGCMRRAAGYLREALAATALSSSMMKSERTFM